MSKNIDKLIKEFKDYNIKKASELQEDPKITTNIFPLDYVLGGGIAQCAGGHRIEFFGAESTAKTTFALHTIKKYQELDKTCVFIDLENSYDKEWAEIIGIDNDKLLVLNPEYLEEAGDLIIKLIPRTDLIVIDSIVSGIPKGEADRDTEEAQMALQARTLSLVCRKMYKALVGQKTTMIFINQLREKVGIQYGNPYTTGGGHAIKHFYNTRVEFKTGKYIDVGSGDKKERIGVEINLKGIKNKKGVPYRKAVVDFYYNGQLDNKTALFFQAVKYGIIKRSGAWYEYTKVREQGKEKLVEKLSNKDWNKIEEEIWKKIK